MNTVLAGLVAIFVAMAVPVQAQPSAVLERVMAIQDAHTPALMATADVLGTATGLGPDNQPAVLVFVNQESPSMAQTIRNLPEFVGNVRLVVRVTDPFRALKGRPGGGGGGGNDGGGGGGVSPTDKQSPPIELGTSGGWQYDVANGFCCGGTLGALIDVGGQKRILSNYHVFEADIVSGGNGQIASTGDPIIQPGLIDLACNANDGQSVATLVVSSALPNSNVDASSANVIQGMVSTDGAILEVGTISSSTVGASLNQRVKKSGRTTGLSRSKVVGLNASVQIAYEGECAGGTAFTKVFTGQIILDNKGSKFIKGGDSGSLMVEDEDTNPKAVGLLYAGSRSTAVANPIDDVLNFFGATIVGQ